MSDGCYVSLELVSAVKESSISTVPFIGVLGKDYLTYACILYEYKHRCTLLICLSTYLFSANNPTLQSILVHDALNNIPPSPASYDDRPSKR